VAHPHTIPLNGPRPGEIVIDDSNYQNFVDTDPIIDGERKTRGLMPRDFNRVPFGSMPFANKYPQDLMIDPSQWDGLYDKMVAEESFLSQIWKRQGVEVQDQNGTNFCWFFGPVSALLAVYARNNQPYVKLSPAFGACQIKNFRNEGGWGNEALEFLVANGCCRADLWPPTAINRKYLTEEAKADAATRKVTEWWDLPPKNFNALMSALFYRIPVAVGYNWWGHEVCALDPVRIEKGVWGIRIVNSWGASWSESGFGILNKSKATPDDAVAPRVGMALAA
jgi:hypothetical protein